MAWEEGWFCSVLEPIDVLAQNLSCMQELELTTCSIFSHITPAWTTTPPYLSCTTLPEGKMWTALKKKRYITMLHVIVRSILSQQGRRGGWWGEANIHCTCSRMLHCLYCVMVVIIGTLLLLCCRRSSCGCGRVVAILVAFARRHRSMSWSCHVAMVAVVIGAIIIVVVIITACWLSTCTSQREHH